MKPLLAVTALIFLSLTFIACGNEGDKSRFVDEKQAADRAPDAVTKGVANPAGDEVITSYYPSGQKEAEGAFKEGKMNGKWVAWYESGQLEREENYVDNLLNGERIVWHENGQKKEVEWYRDDKLEGKKSVFDEEGNLLSEKEYKNGIEVSAAGREDGGETSH